MRVVVFSGCGVALRPCATADIQCQRVHRHLGLGVGTWVWVWVWVRPVRSFHLSERVDMGNQPAFVARLVVEHDLVVSVGNILIGAVALRESYLFAGFDHLHDHPARLIVHVVGELGGGRRLVNPVDDGFFRTGLAIVEIYEGELPLAVFGEDVVLSALAGYLVVVGADVVQASEHVLIRAFTWTVDDACGGPSVAKVLIHVDHFDEAIVLKHWN